MEEEDLNLHKMLLKEDRDVVRKIIHGISSWLHNMMLYRF
jgi:hypothetical protein